jgi:hypothetical protein
MLDFLDIDVDFDVMSFRVAAVRDDRVSDAIWRPTRGYVQRASGYVATALALAA